MLMIMHVELSPWSVLAAVPYVWEAVRNPMAQSTAFRIKRQLQTYSRTHTARTCAGALLIAIALCLMAPASYAQQRQRSGTRQQGIKQSPTSIPLVAGSFDGTLASVDRKHIRLTMAEEQYVEFVRTRKTKFLLNDKEVDAKLLQVGDKVTVEATKEANGDLVALQIINGGKKPAAAAAASTTPAKTDQP